MAGCILLFFCSVTSLFFLPASADSSNYTFPSNKTFRSFTSFPVLHSFLHWNYTPAEAAVDIAYRAASSPGRWIAWAINPTQLGMIGSQALVAVHFPNGSIAAYTTPINSFNPSMQPAPLSFDVQNMGAEYRDGEMIIYAKVALLQNRTAVNQVWQEGPVSDGVPRMHSTFGANVESLGSLDFAGNGGGKDLVSGSRKLLQLVK
ncbi:hypothetical protein ACLOJK_003891 [Asimina triloba]